MWSLLVGLKRVSNGDNRSDEREIIPCINYEILYGINVLIGSFRKMNIISMSSNLD
jgi:hypothetical protein